MAGSAMRGWRLAFFVIMVLCILVACGVLVYSGIAWSRGSEMYSPPICVGILILGIILVIIMIGLCILGSYAVVKKRKLILKLYILIVVIIALVASIVPIIMFVWARTDKVQDEAKSSLKPVYDKYSSQESVRKKIDDFQTAFKCCGITEPFKFNDTYPTSCCDVFLLKKDCLIPFKHGCAPVLAGRMEYDLVVLAWAYIAYVTLFALTAVLALLFLISLKETKRKHKRRRRRRKSRSTEDTTE